MLAEKKSNLLIASFENLLGNICWLKVSEELFFPKL